MNCPPYSTVQWQERNPEKVCRILSLELGDHWTTDFSSKFACLVPATASRILWSSTEGEDPAVPCALQIIPLWISPLLLYVALSMNTGTQINRRWWFWEQGRTTVYGCLILNHVRVYIYIYINTPEMELKQCSTMGDPFQSWLGLFFDLSQWPRCGC